MRTFTITYIGVLTLVMPILFIDCAHAPAQPESEAKFLRSDNPWGYAQAKSTPPYPQSSIQKRNNSNNNQIMPTVNPQYGKQTGYLAVMPLQGDQKLPSDIKSHLNLLCESVRDVAVTATSYKVMTSENIFTILQDKHIDYNKCAGTQCEVEYGRALGADKLVIGNISYVEGVYYLNFSLYDVPTALDTTTLRRECKGCGFYKIMKLVEGMSFELFGLAGESRVTRSSP